MEVWDRRRTGVEVGIDPASPGGVDGFASGEISPVSARKGGTLQVPSVKT